MLRLSREILNKMSDSRLLNHFKKCRDYVRHESVRIWYYGYSPADDNAIIGLAFDETYVEHLRRLLSLRGHVVRKHRKA